MPAANGGVVFDIKHYAIHDGPGIRTTVFLKGCPLKCLWCANPESQHAAPEILFDQEKCSLCRECSHACPQGVISFLADHRVHDRKRCEGCGVCIQACSSEAIELCGYGVDVKTLWEKIEDDRAFWDRSGGGVTLSGGEPLLQHAFVSDFLALCQRRYVHTAIETSGFVSQALFEKVLPHVDLVIFDIKTNHPDTHKECTGVSNDGILSNLKKLLSSPKDVLVRIPLIPGLNDAPQDLEAIGKLLSEARSQVNLEVLPYHRLGEKKYEKLALTYGLKRVQPPTTNQLAQAINIFKRYDINCILPVMEK